MTKNEIAIKVSDRVGFTKTETEVFIDALLMTIKEAVKAGHDVHFRQFGSFVTRHSPERMGRNPRTGEEVPIPAYNHPHFKMSRNFRLMLKDK